VRALRMVDWHHDPAFEDIPDPEPGPGETVITVGGAGVCHSDLHLLYEFPPGAMPWSFPMTLGHENAGWVHRLGAGVSGLEVGQPVAVYGPWGCGVCHACARGEENYCERASLGAPVGGLGANGGMAEFMVVPGARHLVALPDTLGPAEAAPLTDAALTPYHAVQRAKDLLLPGSTAVVIGIGGLGHLAVQILRATTDAQVVAVDVRPDTLALAKTCGADHAIAAGEGAAEAIRELTHGLGAQAIFDMVGSDTSLQLAAATVSVNGHIGLIGLGGGTLAVSLMGLPFGMRVSPTYWGTLPELHEVLRLAARGDLTAHKVTFPLAQADEAYAAVRAGTVTGRAVVVP
jgi:alcohol dehydrogenase, propanol-preferring